MVSYSSLSSSQKAALSKNDSSGVKFATSSPSVSAPTVSTSTQTAKPRVSGVSVVYTNSPITDVKSGIQLNSGEGVVNVNDGQLNGGSSIRTYSQPYDSSGGFSNLATGIALGQSKQLNPNQTQSPSTNTITTNDLNSLANFFNEQKAKRSNEFAQATQYGKDIITTSVLIPPITMAVVGGGGILAANYFGGATTATVLSRGGVIPASEFAIGSGSSGAASTSILPQIFGYGKAVATSTAFTIGATQTAKGVGYVSASKEQKDFYNSPLYKENIGEIYRGQSSKAREQGFFSGVLVNLPFFKSKEFEGSAKDIFASKGLTGADLDFAVASTKRQRTFAQSGETIGLLGISTLSELYGEKLVTQKFASFAGNIAGDRVGRTVAKAVFVPIAVAGSTEGFSTVLNQQLSRSQPINFKDIAIGGAIGAGTAGLFGSGIAGGLASRSAKTRVIGSALQTTGYLTDPFEYPGDKIAGGILRGGARITGKGYDAPVVTNVNTFANAFTLTTTKQGGKPTPSFTPTFTDIKVNTNTQTNTRTQTPANIFQNTFVNTKTNTFTNTRTPTQTFTNTPVTIPTTTNTPVNTFTTVPVNTRVTIPTFTNTPVNTFTTVPVNTILPKLPLFGPGFDLGGRNKQPSGWGSIKANYIPNLRGLVSGKVERGRQSLYTGAEVRGITPDLARALGIKTTRSKKRK